MSIDIIKLVVGVDTLDEFAQIQAHDLAKFEGRTSNIIRTRNRPRREDEILSSGGSAYRVIKGRICCRQKILGFETIKRLDGSKGCLIHMKPEIIETHHIAHRPFQGWRYLKNADRPQDVGPYVIGQNQDVEQMPDEMREELLKAGLI